MDELYAAVAAKLAGLGYEVTDTAEAAIAYSVSRAAESIKIQINRTEIPDGLHHVHVDMAAGLFLRDKKAVGQLDGFFDFASPAKSISEGDVSVTFAGASEGSLSPEARFDAMLNRMINPPQSVFAAFRRLKW